MYEDVYTQGINDLASPDHARVELARDLFSRGGSSAVRALIRALDIENDPLRVRVLRILALLGDARAAQPVTALLHDASSTVRREAASALARISSELTVPALVGFLWREPSPGLRRVAVRSLVRLVMSGHEEPVETLLDLLANPTEVSQLRVAALDAIPFMGTSDAAPSNGTAQSALLATFADDADPAVANKARQLLDNPGVTRIESWAIARLLQDLDSKRQHVWRHALALLVRAGGTVTEPMIQALIAHPHDREFARRCVLVLRGLSPRQIARIGPHFDTITEAIPLEALVDVAASHGSRALLARLAGLISRLATLAEKEGPQRMARARARAHLALARAGSRLAIADLHCILDDPSFPIGPDIIETVSAIGTRTDLRPALRACLRLRGLYRLEMRDATKDVINRERIRRSDRAVLELPRDEQRVFESIVGMPRDRNGVKGSKGSRSPIAPRTRLRRLVATSLSE